MNTWLLGGLFFATYPLTMAVLLCLAGPEPASGGAGSAGRHHPQTDWSHIRGRPEWLTGCATGAKSTGMHLCLSLFHLRINMWHIESFYIIMWWYDISVVYSWLGYSWLFQSIWYNFQSQQTVLFIIILAKKYCDIVLRPYHPELYTVFESVVLNPPNIYWLHPLVWNLYLFTSCAWPCNHF